MDQIRIQMPKCDACGGEHGPGFFHHTGRVILSPLVQKIETSDHEVIGRVWLDMNLWGKPQIMLRLTRSLENEMGVRNEDWSFPDSIEGLRTARDLLEKHGFTVRLQTPTHRLE